MQNTNVQIEFETKQVEDAIAICKKFIKGDSLSLSFYDNIIEVKCLKDGSSYMQKIITEKTFPDFHCCISLKGFQSFILNKAAVRLVYDTNKDASMIFLTNSRSRCKLALLQDIYEEEKDKDNGLANTISPKILNLINTNLKFFEFTSPLYFSKDTLLEIQVRDHIFKMCTLEYFYSALLETEIQQSDIEFNINLRQAFIFNEIFNTSADEVSLSSSSSEVVFATKTQKLVLPQIFSQDTCPIDDIIADLNDNTKAEECIGMVKVRTEDFKSAVSGVDSFIRNNGANVNLITLKVKNGGLVFSTAVESGSFDDVITAKIKGAESFEFLLNLKCLCRMSEAITEELTVIKFYKTRALIKFNNVTYQLLRMQD